MRPRIGSQLVRKLGSSLRSLGAMVGLSLLGCLMTGATTGATTGAMTGTMTGAAARPTELPFTELQRLAPSIRVELRYATTNNFTGKVLYPAEARCYLRTAVAEALAKVATALQAEGLGLKVFDCYRPQRVQFQLWELVHDERYVASPHKGSRHNRGAAVDLTLVDQDGRELPMPTPFDDFTEKAHRSYQDLPAEAKRNRARLEQAMTRAGFVGLPTEWWHFDAADWQRHPLADLPFAALAAARPQVPPATGPTP